MSEPEAISFARLLDWVEGRLPEEEARAVEERVAAGGVVRADVDWLRAFVRLSRNIALEHPPPEIHDELVERFESYAKGRRQPGLLRRLVATLSFDSGSELAVAGVRAANAQEGANRQLIYAADMADVALNIRSGARDNRFDIDGQILPTGDAEPGIFSVQMLHGAKEHGITATDDLGEFAFEGVLPGVYEMVLSNDQVEITIAPIELPSRLEDRP
ncbi:MAG: hypothetical protein M3Q60_15665 [Actinomycetota bacterium]|nr:hypothetical protein [Actinomycetota bacterium]